MPPTASQIGAALRAWRERRRIAREKAAPIADTTTRTLARWEEGTGDVTPPAHQFFALLALYDVADEELADLRRASAARVTKVAPKAKFNRVLKSKRKRAAEED